MRPPAGATDAKDGPASSRRKRLLLLLVVFSLAIGLLLGEVLLRVTWHNPYLHEAPDAILKVPIQHPNTDYHINRRLVDKEQPEVRLRTDFRSYILPSFQFEHPDYTIAFLGGSTTECSAVQEELRFPALVSTLLEKRGLRVNTLNAGRSGNSAHDSVVNLLLHVSADQPNMAVLLHAVNDVGILTRDGDYSKRVGRPVTTSDQLRWMMQRASSRSSLVAITRYVLTHGGISPDPKGDMARGNDPAKPRLEEVPFERRLKIFIHMSKDFDIVPVLMTQPLSSSRNALTPDWADMGNQDRFNAVIRRVGEQEQVPVIDLVRILQEEVDGWNEPMKIFYDGMHVNDDGSRVFAEKIAERLYPLIQADRVAKAQNERR